MSSMASALRRYLSRGDIDRLVWLGYSGGGTLAMLLAPRFDQTTDVVTVAANLDIDAWTDRHGYSRLSGSLNPARQPRAARVDPPAPLRGREGPSGAGGRHRPRLDRSGDADRDPGVRPHVLLGRALAVGVGRPWPLRTGES